MRCHWRTILRLGFRELRFSAVSNPSRLKVRNKEENRDSRRRGSPTLAAAQSLSTGARWKGRPGKPYWTGGHHNTTHIGLSDIAEFGCEVHSYLTPHVKLLMGMGRSRARAQMARPRDSRELGVMAVGDGPLLAMYVNVCMALKQLASIHPHWGP
ncbi:unnamed protein product [Gadus morhua 'NCC']